MKIHRQNPTDIGGTTIRYAELPKFPRPSFMLSLRFPEDITELSAQNCSELLGKYTLMWTYVNQDMTRLRVKVLRYKQKEALRNTALFRERPTLLQQDKWRRDALVGEDAQMELLRYEMASVEAEMEQGAMFLANYDRFITALSRELTRKTHEQGLNRA